MQVNANVIVRLYNSYIKKYIWIAISAFVCMILSAVCNLFIVKFVKPIIDDVFKVDASISVLLSISGCFLLVFVFKGLVNYGENFLLDKLSLKVLKDLQFDVYKNLVYQDLRFFNSTTSGDVISRLTNDLKNVQFALNEVMINLGRNFFTVVTLVMYIFIQNFFLSLTCLIVFPLAGIALVKITKKIKELSRHVQSESGRWTSFLTETFSCIRLIKASSMEKLQIEKAQDILNSIYKLNYKSVQTITIVHPLMELLSGIAVFTCLTVGGMAIIKNYMTVGELFQFLTAFLLTYKPAKTLAQLTSQLQIGNVSTARIFELIDVKSKITNKENPVVISSLSGNIEFDNVSFKYDEEDATILKNINLSIPENKTTVIMGESGIGKSTLINLLLRFYEPNSGEIKIDGINIADMKIKDLHANISVVSQDVELFNDTIKNNIKYGIRSADDESVFEAAAAANIDDFITTLPNGYETMVGEGGVNFSGGQKQRITIARAFLKDAPILVFDEPTSALDGANITFINNSIKRFYHKKTIIIITHDREHFDNVDKLIEFKRDEIVSKIFDHEN